MITWLLYSGCPLETTVVFVPKAWTYYHLGSSVVHCCTKLKQATSVYFSLTCCNNNQNVGCLSARDFFSMIVKTMQLCHLQTALSCVSVNGVHSCTLAH